MSLAAAAVPKPLLLLALLALACAGPARASGPTLAVEDTMHTEVPPVLVSAPRVTLDEILDRVARGEARRDSALRDESFLVTLRVVGHTGAGGRPDLLEERVQRVYKRRPRQVRTVDLRHWEKKPPKKDGDDKGVSVEFGRGMDEDIVNFAFQPGARRQYRYRIEGRELLGDHLIYRIAFEPRSVLEAFEPSGLVWVDTKDFVIVRQEIAFRQSPIPLILRGIKRMVIERIPVADTWVMSRMLVRVETTIPIPHYGNSFDLGISLSDYTINTGLPESLFVVPAKGRKAAGR